MIENYFSKIDNENKAYWLGFLYADGCVEKHLRCAILDISIKDVSHLEKFCKDLEISNAIKYHGDKNQYCKVTINSKKICEDLNKNGCIPAKSLILTFPSKEILPQNLVKHFIRGYFDGDGCLCLCSSTRKSRKKPPTNERFPVKIWFFKLLGTENMLMHIQEYLPGFISLTQEGNIKRLKCGGKQKVYKIMKYLYDDATIYLERKHKIFLDLQKSVLDDMI